MAGPPETLLISHDDHHASDVGRLADGRQFFLTTPFVPAMDGPESGAEYIALYVFDAAGQLESATIEDFGPRATLDEARRETRRDELIASLGAITHADITVAPFAVTRFGIDFGLVPQPPEDPDEDWCVTLEPGDFMCFWPPWDSGEYDT